MPSEALIAAKQQLLYWQDEFLKARQVQDNVRMDRCAQSIRQCEVAIEALERSTPPPLE